jgi:hypothetical protein
MICDVRLKRSEGGGPGTAEETAQNFVSGLIINIDTYGQEQKIIGFHEGDRTRDPGLYRIDR